MASEAVDALSGIAAPLAHRKLLFHVLGDERKASSRVRAFWIIRELEAKGYSVTTFSAVGKLDYLKLASLILSHDAIVFQKRYSRYDTYLMRLARALGKPCFFDIDDNPSRIGSKVSNKNARAMMRHANSVWVGSKQLETYASAETEAIHLIPSTVPLERYRYVDRSARTQPVTIGWIGNGAHYGDDLINILAPALRALAPRHDLTFRLIGANGNAALAEAFESIQGLRCEIIDQIAWDDADAVQAELTSFDIGAYPLLPGEFNLYKCAFKAIEYMATGLPVVASPVGQISDVVLQGETGLLADSVDDWTHALEMLITDRQMCHRMGVAGRHLVESQYSTRAAAARVAKVISEVGPS